MVLYTYDQYFVPVLRALSEGRVMSMKEIRLSVAEQTGATEEDLAVITPSGSNKFGGRVNWAKTYLIKASMISKEGFNRCRITKRGLEALESGRKVDLDYLAMFPEFNEFCSKRSHLTLEPVHNDKTPNTPEEDLESALSVIGTDLEDSLLEKISEMSDSAFEVLVVDLLKRIYGGDFDDCSEVTGGTGDGGIDGIVKQDRLGFNNIYIQAKKWKGNVSRPEIQKFAGALQGQNATYGAFITSSDFTRESREFAEKVNQSSHIVLISGRDLVRLMIEYNVGVVTRRTIEIKGIDSDYFDSV